MSPLLLFHNHLAPLDNVESTGQPIEVSRLFAYANARNAIHVGRCGKECFRYIRSRHRLMHTSHLFRLKDCLQRCRYRYQNYRSNGYSRLYIIECLAMEFAKLILS